MDDTEVKIKQVEALMEANKKDKYLWTTKDSHQYAKMKALNELHDEYKLLIEQWEKLTGKQWVEPKEAAEPQMKFPKKPLGNDDEGDHPPRETVPV